MTFTATDGKEWTYDEWHPLPFIVNAEGRYPYAGVPSTKVGDRLVRKFLNGEVRPWGMFTTTRERFAEMENPATHWMVRSWSDYVI